MTSSANDEWDYYNLTLGIEALEKTVHLAPKNPNCIALQETINFIEYNMRELEIIPTNGD